MLSEARVHPTLPASDLQRARSFYAEKLGLTPSQETPGGLFYDCAAGTRFLVYPGGLGAASGEHTQLGFVVEDIVREVADLKSRGVVFEEYDLPGLKTVDGIAQAGPIRSAWLKDSEGNVLGIVQFSNES